MGALRDLLFLNEAFSRPFRATDRTHYLACTVICILAVILTVLALSAPQVLADTTHLPGDDVSDKLEAAGTLLKLIDTGIFKWGAKVFAGILVLSAGWALKDQRFGIAAICLAGAVMIGTAPKWVKNIFDVGDNQSLFTKAMPRPGRGAERLALEPAPAGAFACA